jgi:hypothetical protein
VPIDKILPMNIILNQGHINSTSVQSYKESDRCLQDLALLGEPNNYIRVVVVFEDAFVWNSNIVLTHEDCGSNNFLQRAMLAEWEFNAGVRPDWWPSGIEADRMWEVHCREDRHNGRAELARGRLDRYDLHPVVRNLLPPRKVYSE